MVDPLELPVSLPPMTRLTFTEYDAYAETVRNVSVSMRMCSRQVSKWTLQYATVGSLVVQHGFEGGGSIAEGVNGSDAWSFYFQSRPGCANGQVLNGDEVFAVPPGDEFCLACNPSHEWLSVHIPASLLFPPTPEFEFASRARAQLLKPPPHVTRRFTLLVQRVLATTESQPELLYCPIAVDSCRDELLSAARELFASCQQVEGRHFDRWRNLTKSTLERAMNCPDRSLSIAELALQTGVPERTFRTAFYRNYGLSPHEYLRIQRLYEARRLLRASRQDRTTVTQIAFGLGFWDLGRFAGRYHTLFGEHPSETLRKDVTKRRATQPATEGKGAERPNAGHR
jgi:AraC family transcriptional regulator, ethanolamine operon transcriptional activator